MTFGRWLLGVALIAAIAIPLVLGARAVRRRFVPEAEGAVALLADAILAVGGLVVLAEVVGVVGLLDPMPLVAGAVGSGVAGRAVGRSGGGDLRGGVAGHAVGRSGGAAASGAGGGGASGASGDGGGRAAASGARGVVTWLGIGAAALVVAAWVRRTLVSLDLGVGGVDSLWYHLPFAAQFAQDGSVASVPYVDLEFLTAFYPANVELLHAVGMVAFGTAALSPLLSLAALGLGLLAGWSAGRPFGAAPLTLLATALALGVPALFESQAGEAKNDVAALAFLLAAAAILLNTRPRASTLALAGAAAGLAAGTKLSLLAPVGALFLALALLHRTRALPFAAGALSTGGYWYLRNLFATGNPLPWLGPLPQPAEARSEQTATTLAGYLFDGGAWDAYFLPALDDVLGPAWPVLTALALAGAVAALIKGDPLVRALGAVALIALAAYVITPSSAAGPEGRPIGFGLNVRYAVPGLLLGLTVAAIVLRRRALLVGAALAVMVVLTQLVPDPIWAVEHRRKAIALTAVALGIALAARRAPKTVAAGAAVVLLAGLWPLERDFLRQQYTATLAPYTSWQAFSLTPVYAWAREQHGARIAVTGTTGAFFQYPLHGPELANDVQLAGRHGDHGSFTPVTTCDQLARALQGRTHAVVTPHLDIWDPYRPLPAPELGWVRDMGGRELLASGEIKVFALPERPACR